MKAVIQRVTSSSVMVDGRTIGKISSGYNVLLGVEPEDTEAHADVLASKIAKLRIFEDEQGKMNKSVIDIGGEVLVISQFTLCADIKKGNRPSFTTAAKPEQAQRLYEYFMDQLKAQGICKVECGSFGADMKVDIQNDGPVTILMDSELWIKKCEI